MRAILDNTPLLPGADHDGPRVPPSEFRIFRAGVNPSTKGDFLFDDAAAKSVMDDWRAWGNRLPIDYDHSMVHAVTPDPAMAIRSAGHFDLELRDGELWATSVVWTKTAHALISEGAVIYFSPAFETDADGRVLKLTNVALTSLPAMHALVPLVAASRSVSAGFIPGDGAPPIVDVPWDADAAVTRLRKWAGIDPKKPLSEQSAARKKYAKAFAYVRNDGLNLGDYALPHHDVVKGKFVTNWRGVVAAAGALAGARGGVRIDSGDLAKVKAHIAGHYHQRGLRAPWEPKSSSLSKDLASMTKAERMAKLDEIHAKLHGDDIAHAAADAMHDAMDKMSAEDLAAYHDRMDKLMARMDDEDEAEDKAADDSDDDDDSKKVPPPSDDEDDEEEDEDKAASKTASKGRAGDVALLSRIAELEKEHAALKRERAAEGRAVLLERGVRDGKISPAEAAGKGNRGAFLKTLSQSQLEAYLEASAKQVATEASIPATPANDGRTFKIALAKDEVPVTVTLSADDLAVAKAVGADPSAVARSRARELAKRSAS